MSICIKTVYDISMPLPESPYSATGTTQIHTLHKMTKGDVIPCAPVIVNLCTENGKCMGIKSNSLLAIISCIMKAVGKRSTALSECPYSATGASLQQEVREGGNFYDMDTPCSPVKADVGTEKGIWMLKGSTVIYEKLQKKR